MDKFLIPKKGLIVRDPISKVPLSVEGEWKTFIGPEGRYWRRRINCGDCFEAKPKERIVSEHLSKDEEYQVASAKERKKKE